MCAVLAIRLEPWDCSTRHLRRCKVSFPHPCQATPSSPTSHDGCRVPRHRPHLYRRICARRWHPRRSVPMWSLRLSLPLQTFHIFPSYTRQRLHWCSRLIWEAVREIRWKCQYWSNLPESKADKTSRGFDPSPKDSWTTVEQWWSRPYCHLLAAWTFGVENHLGDPDRLY